jgi:toxin secretion/phage lysis holin
MKRSITEILIAISSTILYLLGGWDIALKCLVIVMIIDYITGVMSAIFNKKVDSRIGLKGILKKVGYLCIVALSVILDTITGETGVIRTLVIYFFVANDGISIVENIAKMGVPMPKKLLDVLEQLKKKGDE